MTHRYFEDLKVGARFESDVYVVTEAEIIEFARRFDPQSFHLDPTKAARGIFKGLIASGWYTAAITMRLFVQTLNFVEGAIGLGVDELRWPNPVRPDDALRVEPEIVDLTSEDLARIEEAAPQEAVSGARYPDWAMQMVNR